MGGRASAVPTPPNPAPPTTAATVFYPIAMWIRLYNPSPRHRFWLHVLDVFCGICSLLALIGAVQQIVVNIDSVCFFW